MESFYFVDIFSTKGIEYLLVILFLVAFVLYWRKLNMPGRLIKQLSGLPGSAKISTQSGFSIAEDYYYHPGHSWLSFKDNNVVKTGIDEFASKLLGEPDYLVLPDADQIVKQGEKGWVIKKDGKSVEMLSPVSGRVVEVNEAVLDNPSIVSESPYEEGWLFKVEPENLQRNVKNLLKDNYAKAWLEEAVRSLSLRFNEKLGIVMQDGGQPVNGISREINEDNWDNIAREYFLTE